MQSNDTAREFVEDVNNKSDETGVTAKAATHALLKLFKCCWNINYKIGKQGSVVGTGDATQFITVTVTISDTTDLTALRDAINECVWFNWCYSIFFEGDIGKVIAYRS